MKQHFLQTAFSIIILVIFFSFIEKQSSSGKIIVSVSNIKNNNGRVLLTLYNSSAASDYPTNPAKAFRQASASIVNNTANFVLEAVPYGTYAVAVFHDDNNNGAFDTNFMGLPKEGTGASRDAKGSMGPPKFEDAKFQVNTPSTSLKIKMAYLF
jgi:uncharacterized protein (DUF2141 family)